MIRRFLLLCFAAAIAAGPAVAAKAKKPDCVSGDVESALELRMLQTDLMVSALSCKQSANYNAFVKGDQKTLMWAHKTLQGYFRKRGGEKSLNAFITKMANESSRRSVADIARFCADTGVVYGRVLAKDRGDLRAFAAALPSAKLHGVQTCAALEKPAAPAPAEAPKPAAQTPG